MLRRIIRIDEDKCDGCGICADACHEGAIGIVEGKARLLRDDYCDGLGDCLPNCPTGAISFVEREAAEYDKAAVQENMRKKAALEGHADAKGCPGSRSQQFVREEAKEGCPGSRTQQFAREEPAGGCPGSRAQQFAREESAGGCPGSRAQQFARSDAGEAAQSDHGGMGSQLSQWPVQIKLVPVQAPYFDGANLLVAADCTAYAYGNFHRDFIRRRVTLIGCPKLDEGDYTDKLTEIIKNNEIKSLTVVRMEVPCCGGLERAAVQALQASGKFIPWQVVTISTEGHILD